MTLTPRLRLRWSSIQIQRFTICFKIVCCTSSELFVQLLRLNGNGSTSTCDDVNQLLPFRVTKTRSIEPFYDVWQAGISIGWNPFILAPLPVSRKRGNQPINWPVCTDSRLYLLYCFPHGAPQYTCGSTAYLSLSLLAGRPVGHPSSCRTTG